MQPEACAGLPASVQVQVLISRQAPTGEPREALCAGCSKLKAGVPFRVDHHHTTRLAGRRQDAREIMIELVERDPPLLGPTRPCLRHASPQCTAGRCNVTLGISDANANTALT